MVLRLNLHFRLVHPPFFEKRVSTIETTNPTMDQLLPNPKLKLREQLREVIRFKHFSVRTEQAIGTGSADRWPAMLGGSPNLSSPRSFSHQTVRQQ
jgi:hypothetical protein